MGISELLAVASRIAVSDDIPLTISASEESCGSDAET
jgi:hypothetical protein